ncbi:MAG: RES domain-containing protein [Phycisphaerales bacterium]|jgi:RES domain-containing protein|nr:RES domain-containing protein [Phycisphaerales bacterium]
MARHVDTAFDGEGARRFGGRWNSPGTAMVYTAGSQALAVLELLVHLEDSDVLRHFRLIPVALDETMIKNVDHKTLPSNWKRRPTPATVRAIGDAWAASLESVAMRVPSVIVPDEYNILLNPLHGDFARLSIGKPRSYRFDPRLSGRKETKS